MRAPVGERKQITARERYRLAGAFDLEPGVPPEQDVK